jgi:TRAP-type C4-dicarboxylate transport system substrate-binding protein
MKRHRLLSIILSLALIISLSACGNNPESQSSSTNSGSPDKTYSLRLASIYTSEAPIAMATTWFVERVAELTNGAVEITPYFNSGLGDYSAVCGELMAGSIDMAWESMSQSYDDRLYLASTSYMFKNWDEIEYAFNLDSWFCQTIAQIHDEMGIEIIGNAPGGFYGIGGTNLGNLDTLFDPSIPQGVLCRTPSNTISVKCVEALGFNNTVIPYSDLYTSLQTGVCDCWYGGSYDLNYDSFRDVIKYYADFRYSCEYVPLSISKATMDKLPPEYQDAIRQAAKEASAVAFTNVKDSQEDYIKKMEDYGITILTPTDEQVDAISETVRAAVFPEVENLIGADLMSQLKAFLDEVQADA